MMEISVTDAKAQLTELVRRAEEGDEVILTRHGRPAVKLSPIAKPVDMAARRALIAELQKQVAKVAIPGSDAAHSQDYLYGDDGLPR
jgi:prevent-host-death family protein